MNYEKIKQEFSEWLGTIIDRESSLEDDVYDVSLDYDFETAFEKVKEFLKRLEKRQIKENRKTEIAIEERHNISIEPYDNQNF